MLSLDTDIKIKKLTRDRLMAYKYKWELTSMDKVINAALDGYEVKE